MIWQAGILSILVFGGFVAFVILMRARRRRQLWEDSAPPQPAFDAVELDHLQATGEVTPEEAARIAAATARQQAASATSQSTHPPGPRGFDVLPISQRQ